MENEAPVPQHPRCKGCCKVEKCEKAKSPPALANLNERRATNCEKYFVCNSLFEDIAERPPDDKATRRNFGESAIHY